MKSNFIPMRRCAGCGKSRPKDELDRYVIRPMDKCYVYDAEGTAPGRGAYLCKGSEECFNRAQKKRRMDFRRFD
ncbi:MAG: YlxR family protein [Firmicutes bacterium]|nr:YlxR family protein [Bacillota bacterium]